MIAFVQQYLPQIIAGLLPAIVVAGQSIHLLIKNIGVKKEISELNTIFNKVTDKSIGVSEALENSIPLLTNIFTDGIGEFQDILAEVRKIIEELLVKELTDFKNDVTAQMKEQRELHQSQILSLRIGVDKNEDAEVL